MKIIKSIKSMETGDKIMLAIVIFWGIAELAVIINFIHVMIAISKI